MKRVLVLGWLLFGVGCAKTVVGTETGNPPVVSASSVMVEAIDEDRVRVSGEPGAVTPGGGEVTITNTSRDGDPVVVDVEQDGSFSAELEGEPGDDYAVTASNEAGDSKTRTVTGNGSEPPPAGSGAPPPAGSGAPPPGDWHELHLCDDADPMDPIRVTELRIDGDTLHVGVSHGGGCQQHEYGLCYGGAWAESYPIQVGFQVLHVDKDDTCNRIVSENLSFDLAPFKQAYVEAYQTDFGAAHLQFESCLMNNEPQVGCSVLYEFGYDESACGPPIGAACPMIELGEAPADWVEHSTTCNFSFRGPADLTDANAQGEDSCVMRFENDACTFLIGSGGFSNGLTEFEDADEYEAGQSSAAQGYTAKVVTGVRPDQPQPYLAGIHFPDPPFDESDTFDVTADLVIFCSTREQRDAMLPVLGTVQFE